jgi:hypothetical protein
MKHQHYAYIGAEDDPFEVAIEQVHSTMGPDSLLTIERVPGDHFTSFDESLQRYLQVVQSNP